MNVQLMRDSFTATQIKRNVLTGNLFEFHSELPTLKILLYSDSNCISALLVFCPSSKNVIFCESVTLIRLWDYVLVGHIF